LNGWVKIHSNMSRFGSL